jgi:hypothetical protein
LAELADEEAIWRRDRICAVDVDKAKASAYDHCRGLKAVDASAKVISSENPQ